MNKITNYLLITIILLTTSNCAIIGVATTATTGVMIADERSVGNIIDDKVIATKIRHEYIKNSINNSLKGISLEVYEGRVLLIGYVIDNEYKEEAEKLAWLVRGVKEVINNIIISNEDPASFTRDIWISTKVKTKFLANKELHSINYKIMVYNRVVYLLGVAETQKELDTALKVSSEVSGVFLVKNYILVKNDSRRKAN